jgi:hypothetical protein
MTFENMDEKTLRLAEIGAVMDSIGVSTVELAQKLKEHLEGCTGGRGCLEKLIIENK